MGEKVHIVLAPGHSFEFKGVHKNNYYEYDEVNKIVELLVPKLEALNHQVTVVRGKLIDKVNQINEINPDLAVEIHLGNTNNQNISGSRSFYSQNNPKSKYLAESVLEGVVRMLGTHNVGSWIGWYKKISPSLVKNGKAPSDWRPKIDLFLSKINTTTCLIEPFYLSSVSDVEKFLTRNKHEFVAEAVKSGIEIYLKDEGKIESESTMDELVLSAA